MIKCSCGKWFCCKCHYGINKHEREIPRDLLDDLKIPIGYKLMKGTEYDNIESN